MMKRLVMAFVVLSAFAAATLFGVYGPAGASTIIYTHAWTPPLNEASNYRPCCPSSATFTTLPFTMSVLGAQRAQLEVRMRTNWVDTKARTYTPNIIQQGRVAHPLEIKISIHSGRNSFDHHAQCRIEGASGVIVNAQGPKSIDIADGNWHTTLCVKSPDSKLGTNVQVFVDGVAGPVFHTSTPLGNITFTSDKVDLGGQGTIANKDSIDGQYSSVTYTVG